MDIINYAGNIQTKYFKRLSVTARSSNEKTNILWS